MHRTKMGRRPKPPGLTDNRGQLPIYDVVWMCVPYSPLFRAARYMTNAFLKRKVYEWPYLASDFFLYEQPKFSCTHVYAHIFHLDTRQALFHIYIKQVFS